MPSDQPSMHGFRHGDHWYQVTASRTPGPPRGYRIRVHRTNPVTHATEKVAEETVVRAGSAGGGAGGESESEFLRRQFERIAATIRDAAATA